MKGAIIGDIVGSIYEWHNIKTKEFPLFQPQCFFTDDTVMTCAVAKTFLEFHRHEYCDRFQERLIENMQDFGRRYEGRGYGGHFLDWIYEEHPRPYGSCGNGSAMRVSPVAWVFKVAPPVKPAAVATAMVTHNHPDGIRGAVATAACIYEARQLRRRMDIRMNLDMPWYKDMRIRNEHKDAVMNTCLQYYNYNFCLDEIRPTYHFGNFQATCKGTVPYAVQAFMEAEDFEDAIRNAISIGGDSDTLAAITGSIAEGFYGVPDDLWEKTRAYLTPELAEIVDEFYEQIGHFRIPDHGASFRHSFQSWRPE
jgi:ADP-ribosylglycohydrolase